MKIALLTNGPGELWNWARPVITELRKREHSVSLWLLPCQYSSGYERVAASQLGVDKLEGPSGAAWMWRALGQEKTDRVLQLGGDLMFGRRIAARSGAPLICYAYAFKRGMERARVFTAYRSMAGAIDAKLKGGGANVIGDLVKDSLTPERAGDFAGTLKWEGGGPRVLFFPGSRPAIREAALSWLRAVAGRLSALTPGVQIAALFPPFVPDDELTPWAEAGLNPIKAEPGAAMKSADYALTQPGTNTVEMMHCGLPALVAAPSDFLNVIPVGGISGLVLGVPVLGPALRRRALLRNLERYNGFISWPNRIANRMLLDEASGGVTPEDLAARIAASLGDKEKLAGVREALLELSGEGGAVRRLCDAVELG